MGRAGSRKGLINSNAARTAIDAEIDELVVLNSRVCGMIKEDQ